MCGGFLDSGRADCCCPDWPVEEPLRIQHLAVIAIAVIPRHPVAEPATTQQLGRAKHTNMVA